MSVAAPPSPGAPSDVGEDEQPPEADDAAVDAEEVDEAAPDADSPTQLLTFYAKHYYVINPDHVRFNVNKPLMMSSGLAMYELHDSKSFKNWDEIHLIRPGNIIKVVAGGQCGWYICFAKKGVESNDKIVARAIHKQIAKRFFDLWNKDWSPERKERYAELLRDEPSDIKQINPPVVGWDEVSTPSNILYERPKNIKGDKVDGPLKSAIGKGGAKTKPKPKVEVDDDDDQSSAAMSNPPATPNDTALVGFRSQPFAMQGSAPQIFLHTPGTVTVSEVWLQQLIANQRP